MKAAASRAGRGPHRRRASRYSRTIERTPSMAEAMRSPKRLSPKTRIVAAWRVKLSAGTSYQPVAKTAGMAPVMIFRASRPMDTSSPCTLGGIVARFGKRSATATPRMASNTPSSRIECWRGRQRPGRQSIRNAPAAAATRASSHSHVTLLAAAPRASNTVATTVYTPPIASSTRLPTRRRPTPRARPALRLRQFQSGRGGNGPRRASTHPGWGLTPRAGVRVRIVRQLVFDQADAGVGEEGGGEQPGARVFEMRRGSQHLALERCTARQYPGRQGRRPSAALERCC